MGKRTSRQYVPSSEEVPICHSHQAQRPPVRPWGHAIMEGTLLGDLLSSGQLDICQVNSSPEHPQRNLRQLFLAYTQADKKSEILMEITIWFVV